MGRFPFPDWWTVKCHCFSLFPVVYFLFFYVCWNHCDFLKCTEKDGSTFALISFIFL